MATAIRTTTQGQVLENIKRFAAILGNFGAVAGGAVRDLHCGVVPKDYDLFVYKMDNWAKINEALLESTDGDWELLRGSDDGNDNDEYYNSVHDSIRVETVLCKGIKVQLICWGCHDNTPQSVVSGFDFTINMMGYSVKDGFVITDAAKEALALEEMILNPEHRQRWIGSDGPNNNKFIAQSLVKRGERIARKLGFVIPQRTIDAILNKYPFVDEEILDMDL